MSRGVDRLLSCVTKFMGKEVLNLQRSSWTGNVFYKAKKGPMFSRDTRWTNATKMGTEEWYKMYVRPFHPELALVGMQVLVLVISALSSMSCERNWSAHGHIH